MSDLILLVGEAPSRDDGAPLEGAIALRLGNAAGLTQAEYLERTERRNLFQSPVETWSPEEASNVAELLWPSLVGRRTILLGQRVSKAFGVRWQNLKWVVIDDRGTALAIVPHPSGRNTWWNDPENRTAARLFLSRTFGTDG